MPRGEGQVKHPFSVPKSSGALLRSEEAIPHCLTPAASSPALRLALSMRVKEIPLHTSAGRVLQPEGGKRERAPLPGADTAIALQWSAVIITFLRGAFLC